MSVTFDPANVSDWYISTTVEAREDAGERVYVSLETITTRATDYESHGWLEGQQEDDPDTVHWWEDVLEAIHAARVYAVEHGVRIPDVIFDMDLDQTAINYRQWLAEQEQDGTP